MTYFEASKWLIKLFDKTNKGTWDYDDYNEAVALALKALHTAAVVEERT